MTLSYQTAQTCAICGATPARSVFKDRNGHVLECRSCGLQFAEHYPDLTADDTVYGSEYFHAAIENWEHRAGIFRLLLQEVEAVAGRKGRLLDVGTGEGGLIKAAAERGWEAEGTEIARPMMDFVANTLGLTVHEGELEALELPDHHYDAIVLNHVLEHVRNPVRTLHTVEKLLCPGGVVRVEVPNILSLSSRLKNVQSRLHLKQSPWKHYSTGHHYWFFSPRTLQATFEAAGLRVIALRAPARQWGAARPQDTILNGLYRRGLLGGHLVAYGAAARPAGA